MNVACWQEDSLHRGPCFRGQALPASAHESMVGMQQLWAATGSSWEVTGRQLQKVGVRQAIKDEGGRDRWKRCQQGCTARATRHLSMFTQAHQGPGKGLILASTLSDSGLGSVSPLRQKGAFVEPCLAGRVRSTRASRAMESPHSPDSWRGPARWPVGDTLPRRTREEGGASSKDRMDGGWGRREATGTDNAPHTLWL